MKRHIGLICLTIGALLASQLVLARQAHVNLDWNPHKNTEDLLPFGMKLVSPDVQDDRKATFRVAAPDAHEVALTGYALFAAVDVDDPLPMKKSKDGIWQVTIGPLEPNIYVYRMRIDGVNVADPSNTIAGYADQAPYSVLVVHSDGPAYYDARNVPHGAVTRHATWPPMPRRTVSSSWR